MTDYFEELNCQPIPDEEVQSHQLMLMVRFMRQNGFLNEDYERELRAPPAAKEVIEALKEKRVTKNDEKCTICLKPNDEIEPETGTLNDLFKILPCKHEFHATCILPWLAKTNSCPLCRFEMKTDDEIYEEQKRHRARQAQREAEIESLHDSMYG